ncbi:hypothetical protein [Actinophytocola xanthii]|nr:hypothetical protein [Actinophytocola xanthii]
MTRGTPTTLDPAPAVARRAGSKAPFRRLLNAFTCAYAPGGGW